MPRPCQEPFPTCCRGGFLLSVDCFGAQPSGPPDCVALHSSCRWHRCDCASSEPVPLKILTQGMGEEVRAPSGPWVKVVQASGGTEGCREVSPSLLTLTCLVPTRVAFPCAGGERVFTVGLYETRSGGHTGPGPLTLEGNVENFGIG